MAQVLVRNLDEEVVASLKDRARLSGQPLETFLRGVLCDAARLTGPEKAALVEAHMARFAGQAVDADFDVGASIRAGRDDEEEYLAWRRGPEGASAA